MEITPREISEDVLMFCKSVNDEEVPRYIIVEPFQNCKENYCYENVEAVIAENGGAAENGWVIWKRDNMYLEAEAHAVWVTVEGNWVDVTPHTPTEEQIVFLPDKSVTNDGSRTPSEFFQLTESEDVKEYINMFLRIREIEDEKRDASGLVKLSGQQIKEYQEIMAKLTELNSRFEEKVGRNDPCPCGSGLKYKKCCGKYR